MLIVALLFPVLLVPTGAQAAPPHQAQEQRFVELINASRAARGHRALVTSASAADVARNWSKRMAADGNLRHNPNVGRQLDAGWRRWGENVGWASNRSGGALADVTRRLHRGFMESPGHRANIMGDFNQVGVGVAVDAKGTMWATVVFVNGPVPREAAATPGGLGDIAGNPHRAAITTAWKRGLMRPCERGRFCPRRAATRAEVAVVVARMITPDPATGSHFDDVGTQADTINALAEAGVVAGCAPRRFCPQRPVTRAQLAAMLVRALPGLEPVSGTRFRDLPDGYVHTGAINALAAAGITQGCDTRRFCPTAKVTRGQLASLVVRAQDG